MSDFFAPLRGEKYVLLTTYRRSGQGVPTPVWFAEEGGKLYVNTRRESGKVKRLGHTAKVDLVACTMRGTPKNNQHLSATARLLETPEEEQHAEALLRRKYGLLYRLFGLFSDKRQRIFIEITPSAS
jgi:PPOX class probable F420-dependent enzyme